LFVLGIGILCARPDSGFVSVIVSDHAGGVLARRMLPVAILVPAGLGWLTLSGQRAALFSDALGLAIAAAVTIFAFAAFIATTARSLSRADRVRKASERHLAAQNVTTCVLVESATLAEAMPRVLEAVCKSLDWVMGVRWSVDSQAHVLRCAEMHVAPAAAVARIGRGQSSRHIPARRWASGPGLEHRTSRMDCRRCPRPELPTGGGGGEGRPARRVWLSDHRSRRVFGRDGVLQYGD